MNLQLNSMPYITLWAARFEEEVALYKHVLGLPVADENENFIMFGTQGARVAIHRLGDVAPVERRAIELHFDVPDVDAAVVALKAKGIVFEHGPANKPWGQRQAGFKDPEGFDVELVGPIKTDEPIEDYG